MVSGKLDSEAYRVEIKAQDVEIKNVRAQGEPENGICCRFVYCFILRLPATHLGVRLSILVTVPTW